MKASLFMNTLLGTIAILLAIGLLQRLGTDSTVSAQSGGKFGYVQIHVLDIGLPVVVTDLRNGNIWSCKPGGQCQFTGRIPLEQLDTAPRP